MSLAAYYKMFEPLFKEYNLVMIDLPSWGLSTRVQRLPEEVKDFDSARLYNIGWLEKWMDKAGLPATFYLHGHGFGGLLAFIHAS